MNDGTTQEFSVTRHDMEYWLTEKGLTKLIDTDTDKMFSNYQTAYKNDYNKTHKKPKGTLGGARPGAGRKPKGGTEKLHYGWRVSRDVWDILQQQDNKTDFIERAIRAYYRAYMNKRGDGD